MRKFDAHFSWQFYFALELKEKNPNSKNACLQEVHALKFVSSLIFKDVNVLAANENGGTNDLWFHVLRTFAKAFDKLLKKKGDNVSCLLHDQ